MNPLAITALSAVVFVLAIVRLGMIRRCMPDERRRFCRR